MAGAGREGTASKPSPRTRKAGKGASGRHHPPSGCKIGGRAAVLRRGGPGGAGPPLGALPGSRCVRGRRGPCGGPACPVATGGGGQTARGSAGRPGVLVRCPAEVWGSAILLDRKPGDVRLLGRENGHPVGGPHQPRGGCDAGGSRDCENGRIGFPRGGDVGHGACWPFVWGARSGPVPVSQLARAVHAVGGAEKVGGPLEGEARAGGDGQRCDPLRDRPPRVASRGPERPLQGDRPRVRALGGGSGSASHPREGER